MLYVGVDPDTKHMPYVCINDNLEVQWIEILQVPTKLKGAEALTKLASLHIMDNFPSISSKSHVIAVEGQQYYPHSKVSPQSLITLATAGGMATSFCYSNMNVAMLYLPAPKTWKGNVPKLISQKRILKRFGLDYEEAGGKSGYCCPTDKEFLARFPHIKKSSWKHVVDGLGLCLFARDQYLKDKALESYLK